jgi:hypothetical protein
VLLPPWLRDDHSETEGRGGSSGWSQVSGRRYASSMSHASARGRIRVCSWAGTLLGEAYRSWEARPDYATSRTGSRTRTND